MLRSSSRHWGLALILAGFIMLATVYSLITPLFEASDELWHYPMIKYVADHRLALPVQDPARSDAEAPWRQEGSQPPLYYMLGAALTFWIDTSDMQEVRRLNPHADIGVLVPDGNVNMVVHSERENSSRSGTVLAMYLVRLMSIVMGAGTVFFTYLLGRELFPDNSHIALTAAALTAFNPMFLFISAVINNDNLSTLIASVLLYLIVRMIKRWDQPPSMQFYVLLGCVTGAGMLAKFQIGFMLPLIALTLLIISIRARDWRPLVIGGAISGGLTILIAGWWYGRNYDLYGDATGINVFLDIVGRRAVPADLHQLWTERETFMMAFWGFFGGLNVAMFDFVYWIFNAIAGIGVLGLFLMLVHTSYQYMRKRTTAPDWALMLARGLAAIWPVVVFISLLSWTHVTWASQGRLWFSAIAALNVWLAVGLINWEPRWRIISRGALVFFIGVAVIAPFFLISRAYTLPPYYWDSNRPLWKVCYREPGSTIEHVAICTETEISIERSMTYNYRDYSYAGLLPGDYLQLQSDMAVENTMARDWSVFVHMVNENGTIEAQRDVYPGGGLLATSELQPGMEWNNFIAVKIPEGLYASQTLNVYLGFYDLDTGERMIPEPDDYTLRQFNEVNAHFDQDSGRLWIGRVILGIPPGVLPNPVDVNFGRELLLRGYEISERALKPGDTTEITLYWQALKPLDTNYVISIQIIDPDPDKLIKAAQDDQPPTPPTAEWRRGENIEERRTLTVFPDVPPGRYRLMVRVYPAGDAAHPLRVRSEAGDQSEDFVWLSWVQVE